MAGAKTRFANVEVRELALVKAGDNRGARSVLWKSLPEPTPGERLDLLGPFAKEMFSDYQENRLAGQSYEVLQGRLWALESALWDALFMDESRGREKELIEASVAQFADSIDSDLGGILAGNILKAFQPWLDAEAPPPRENFTKSVGKHVEVALDHLTSSAGGSPGDDTKEKDMAKKIAVAIDTGGLSDDQRAALTKTLEDQGFELAEPSGEETTELEKLAGENVTLRSQVAELSKTKAAEDTRTDLEKALDSLPAPVRDLIQKNERETAEAKAESATIRKEADRREFAKAVDFQFLPGTVDERVEALADLPREQRDAVVKVLGVADEALRRSGITKERGNDQGAGDAGTAEAQVEALAKEIRKSQPGITPEQARAQVYLDNPDLWAEVDAEDAQAN